MDTRMKCIAIDDEPIALSVITQFCNRLGNIGLAVYSDPQVGLEAVLKERPDIVFLDIEMNDINGLSIAKQIGDKTAFIFTTAYLQYALDGFDLDAVDFLHKPFAYDRFRQAMEKASRRVKYMKSGEARKVIIVKQEYADVSVPVSEIMYVEAMENYSKIFKIDGTCIISHSNLKGIMDMLPLESFVRIHRSYIAPVNKIMSFNKQSIRLSSGKILPVGKQFADNLSNIMNTISNQ